MRGRALRIAGAGAAVLVWSSCAVSTGVSTDEAAAIVATTSPPATAPATVPPSSGPATSTPPGTGGVVGAAAWTACPGVEDDTYSMPWECAWVDVPLDRADLAAGTVTVAITRPVMAEGDDRRPLVMDPGGPGASGTEFAWTFVDVLPPDLLDAYYPVGWDPRGTGLSDPPIDCGSLGATGVPEAAGCVRGTGPLLAQVGAADAALDLEEVRQALGVERLDYLGYSYGTALGAVYAMAHPDHVGRFVLDGSIDPQAGDPAGELAADGAPDYAADESADVIARFHELCGASASCAAGPDSQALLDALEGTIRTLPTDHFDGEPAQLGRIDLDDLMFGVMFDPWSWGLVGDALRDGADGDASTLAALTSYLLNGYPVGVADSSSEDRFSAANYAIHCADFSDVPDVWGCQGMPAADSLPVIAAVDVAEPILVVGTRFDPLTPGRHATEMAAALGDATSITWEGVGHTAFPIGECLDGAVVDYLVDGVVPVAGTTCPFVDGATTDAEIADELFGYQRWWVDPAIEDVLVAEGAGARDAKCQARILGGADHRVITHLLLGVESDAAVAARTAAEASC